MEEAGTIVANSSSHFISFACGSGLFVRPLIRRVSDLRQQLTSGQSHFTPNHALFAGSGEGHSEYGGLKRSQLPACLALCCGWLHFIIVIISIIIPAPVQAVSTQCPV